MDAPFLVLNTHTSTPDRVQPSTVSLAEHAPFVASEMVTPIPPKAHANKLGIPSPDSTLVKVELSTPPPPLIEDTSGIPGDGKFHDQQVTVGLLQGQSSPVSHTHPD